MEKPAYAIRANTETQLVEYDNIVDLDGRIVPQGRYEVFTITTLHSLPEKVAE